ncbi:cytochrome c oxidase subunit II [Aquihabitans sp. G128]|uniref:cytochrome c oxidase subunit II n=1 Tax=Aquihabitans sp. G128 TaxID=2849779 RepID=UPI001C21B88F|nr:cytochrome c oxidase subunit II [Aquihabitans sp. G128]QXC59487.1 cytochrome c oxidase subunit II [Aquihabitans sp. G128]
MKGRARTRLLKLAPMVLGVMVFAASCAKDAPQTTLKPKGPEAEKINNLINPIFGIAGVVFVLILGGALFVALKFRAKDDDDFDEFPSQVHGNFKLEIGWTAIPAVILAVVGGFTVATIFDLAQKPDPKTAVQVEVIGQQWWWEYRYDTNNDGKFDEIITANDLVIPAGREISLHIKSRDVIHSWWAPALNGKKDAVPGRTHPLTIEANSPGEYIGQCTEFCGLSHAEMRIKVVALDENDYQAWTEHQQKEFNPRASSASDSALAGWTTFNSQCTSCHRITGLSDAPPAGDPGKTTGAFKYPPVVNQVSGEAPNLTHFMSRSTFAGAKFNLRKDTKACRDLGEDWAQTDAGIKKCLNRTDLQAWLRNAPSMKAMKPGDVPSPESRGMPNFNLSEDQINDLVAFLTTLK